MIFFAAVLAQTCWNLAIVWSGCIVIYLVPYFLVVGFGVFNMSSPDIERKCVLSMC